MKLKDILIFIPGVQILCMIATHRKGMRELKQSWEGYQSSVRQDYMAQIRTLREQRNTANKSQIPSIDEQIMEYQTLYTNSLTR